MAEKKDRYRIDLKSLRRSAGIKQLQMSEILGVSQPEVSRRERLMMVSAREYEILKATFGEETVSVYAEDIDAETVLEQVTKSVNEDNVRSLKERVAKLEQENERLLGIIERLAASRY